MWKKHYESLLNSVKSCDLNNEVSNEFTKITEFSCKVSGASIANSFRHLKSGKASGVDGLLRNISFMLMIMLMCICHYCLIVFSCHGYLPLEFMKTAIVPIIKSKTGNSSDKYNYRPISNW